jgi:hypothetical protein
MQRLEDDIDSLMGVYELMVGKVVSGRAVWQKQGGAKEWFLYYSCSNNWGISAREYMEVAMSRDQKVATTWSLL